MVTERKTIEIVLTNNDHVKLLVQILFFCNVDMKKGEWPIYLHQPNIRKWLCIPCVGLPNQYATQNFPLQDFHIQKIILVLARNFCCYQNMTKERLGGQNEHVCFYRLGLGRQLGGEVKYMTKWCTNSSQLTWAVVEVGQT